LVLILAGTQAILITIVCGFIQSLQADAGKETSYPEFFVVVFLSPSGDMPG
jgi:hypothetical protein